MKLKSKWRKHASSVARRFHVSLREPLELVMRITMTNAGFLNVSQTKTLVALRENGVRQIGNGKKMDNEIG
jgi:hypothetical protein